MFTAKKVYTMLENESLWQAAAQFHRLLAAAKIPHAVVGGMAVCLHGYHRNTTNIDMLIRQEDSGTVIKALDGEKFAIRLLFAGERAGAGSDVKFPDPRDEQATTEIEDLPVLTLAKLIEAKIACGLGNLRRTHKDFADVIELIIQKKLNSSFARSLHKSLRVTYRDLVRRSRATL
jgi:hypothetical protein